MSRKKLLIENFFIYGLGEVAGKIIPFIFLPLLTRLLPDTSIYGNYDYFKVLGSFAVIFAGLGIGDSMFRFYYDKEDLDYQLSVCSTSLFIVFISSIFFGTIIFFLRDQLAVLLFKDVKYSYLIIAISFTVIIEPLYSITIKPYRILNKRKIVILISWLSPLLSYGIIIPLVIYWKPLPALVIGTLVSPTIITILSLYLNRRYFRLKRVNIHLLKPMLLYGLPLVPTFLIYWVFKSIDRVMITSYIGTSALGLYAIGGKLGMISKFFTRAFSRGYEYFLYSTMKYDDRVEKNSMLFEFFAVVNFIILVTIFPFIKIIFKILFAVEYYNGHIVASYLLLTPLLLLLFQIVSSQNTIDKKSYIPPLLLIPGLILNIFLNRLLIPKIGIEGAAISTVLGYVLSIILAIIVTKFRKAFVICERSILILSLTPIFFIFMRLFMNNMSIQLMFTVIGIIIIIILYNKAIKSVFFSIRRKKHG